MQLSLFAIAVISSKFADPIDVDWLGRGFGFSNWLLRQASFTYIALLPVALVSAWGLWELRKSRGAIIPTTLPIWWLIPIAFAGAFEDVTASEPKTADWVGWVALTCLIVQITLTAFSVLRLKKLRPLAVVAGLVNLVVGLMSAGVTGMASSGDWL